MTRFVFRRRAELSGSAAPRRIRVAGAAGIRRRAAERAVTPAMVATAADTGRTGAIVGSLRRARPAYPRRAHVLHRAVALLSRMEAR